MVIPVESIKPITAAQIVGNPEIQSQQKKAELVRKQATVKAEETAVDLPSILSKDRPAYLAQQREARLAKESTPVAATQVVSTKPILSPALKTTYVPVAKTTYVPDQMADQKEVADQLLKSAPKIETYYGSSVVMKQKDYIEQKKQEAEQKYQQELNAYNNLSSRDKRNATVPTLQTVNELDLAAQFRESNPELKSGSESYYVALEKWAKSNLSEFGKIKESTRNDLLTTLSTKGEKLGKYEAEKTLGLISSDLDWKQTPGALNKLISSQKDILGSDYVTSSKAIESLQTTASSKAQQAFLAPYLNKGYKFEYGADGKPISATLSVPTSKDSSRGDDSTQVIGSITFDDQGRVKTIVESEVVYGNSRHNVIEDTAVKRREVFDYDNNKRTVTDYENDVDSYQRGSSGSTRHRFVDESRTTKELVLNEDKLLLEKQREYDNEGSVSEDIASWFNPETGVKYKERVDSDSKDITKYWDPVTGKYLGKEGQYFEPKAPKTEALTNTTYIAAFNELQNTLLSKGVDPQSKTFQDATTSLNQAWSSGQLSKEVVSGKIIKTDSMSGKSYYVDTKGQSAESQRILGELSSGKIKTSADLFALVGKGAKEIDLFSTASITAANALLAKKPMPDYTFTVEKPTPTESKTIKIGDTSSAQVIIPGGTITTLLPSTKKTSPTIDNIILPGGDTSKIMSNFLGNVSKQDTTVIKVDLDKASKVDNVSESISYIPTSNIQTTLPPRTDTVSKEKTQASMVEGIANLLKGGMKLQNLVPVKEANKEENLIYKDLAKEYLGIEVPKNKVITQSEKDYINVQIGALNELDKYNKLVNEKNTVIEKINAEVDNVDKGLSRAEYDKRVAELEKIDLQLKAQEPKYNLSYEKLMNQNLRDTLSQKEYASSVDTIESYGARMGEKGLGAELKAAYSTKTKLEKESPSISLQTAPKSIFGKALEKESEIYSVSSAVLASSNVPNPIKTEVSLGRKLGMLAAVGEVIGNKFVEGTQRYTTFAKDKFKGDSVDTSAYDKAVSKLLSLENQGNNFLTNLQVGASEKLTKAEGTKMALEMGVLDVGIAGVVAGKGVVTSSKTAKEIVEGASAAKKVELGLEAASREAQVIEKSHLQRGLEAGVKKLPAAALLAPVAFEVGVAPKGERAEALGGALVSLGGMSLGSKLAAPVVNRIMEGEIAVVKGKVLANLPAARKTAIEQELKRVSYISEGEKALTAPLKDAAGKSQLKESLKDYAAEDLAKLGTYSSKDIPEVMRGTTSDIFVSGKQVKVLKASESSESILNPDYVLKPTDYKKTYYVKGTPYKLTDDFQGTKVSTGEVKSTDLTFRKVGSKEPSLNIYEDQTMKKVSRYKDTSIGTTEKEMIGINVPTGISGLMPYTEAKITNAINMGKEVPTPSIVDKVEFKIPTGKTTYTPAPVASKEWQIVSLDLKQPKGMAPLSKDIEIVSLPKLDTDVSKATTIDDYFALRKEARPVKEPTPEISTPVSKEPKFKETSSVSVVEDYYTIKPAKGSTIKLTPAEAESKDLLNEFITSETIREGKLTQKIGTKVTLEKGKDVFVGTTIRGTQESGLGKMSVFEKEPNAILEEAGISISPKKGKLTELDLLKSTPEEKASFMTILSGAKEKTAFKILPVVEKDFTKVNDMYILESEGKKIVSSSKLLQGKDYKADYYDYLSTAPKMKGYPLVTQKNVAGLYKEADTSVLRLESGIAPKTTGKEVIETNLKLRAVEGNRPVLGGKGKQKALEKQIKRQELYSAKMSEIMSKSKPAEKGTLSFLKMDTKGSLGRSPKSLFHGTSEENLAKMGFSGGLKPSEGKLYLTEDKNYARFKARQLAEKSGTKPVVIEVPAETSVTAEGRHLVSKETIPIRKFKEVTVYPENQVAKSKRSFLGFLKMDKGGVVGRSKGYNQYLMQRQVTKTELAIPKSVEVKKATLVSDKPIPSRSPNLILDLEVKLKTPSIAKVQKISTAKTEAKFKSEAKATYSDYEAMSLKPATKMKSEVVARTKAPSLIYGGKSESVRSVGKLATLSKSAELQKPAALRLESVGKVKTISKGKELTILSPLEYGMKSVTKLSTVPKIEVKTRTAEKLMPLKLTLGKKLITEQQPALELKKSLKLVQRMKYDQKQELKQIQKVDSIFAPVRKPKVEPIKPIDINPFDFGNKKPIKEIPVKPIPEKRRQQVQEKARPARARGQKEYLQEFGVLSFNSKKQNSYL
jgi:hypothetical protein